MKLVYAEKKLFFIGWLCMSKKADLFRNQSTAYLSKPFYCSQTPPISATDTTNSHPAITYCPPKNDAVLLISALTPYAVKPEPRTDSKPFRRRLVRKTGFDTCRRKALQSYFRQSFESSPESRGSQTSGVLPVLFVQAKRIKPFPFRGSFDVLQTSNQLAAMAASLRQN